MGHTNTVAQGLIDMAKRIEELQASLDAANQRATEAESKLAALAGTTSSRFHVLLDGIREIGWVHPSPHDSANPPENYALEWLMQQKRRLALAVAEVRAWRSGRLRLRPLRGPTGGGNVYYEAFGDTTIWAATNADPELAKMLAKGGGEG